MPDARAHAAGSLRIVWGIRGLDVAAEVFAPNQLGHSLLKLNRELLCGRDFEHVLSWARRELASGMPAAWLLADELADLA